jgi:hypothetical protein
MKNAEKTCQKIKTSRIPFSPEAAKLIPRVQAYKSLLQFAQGGCSNRGNLCCAAYRAGILTPWQLSVGDIQDRIKVGQQHCEYYRQHGRRYRKRHLQIMAGDCLGGRQQGGGETVTWDHKAGTGASILETTEICYEEEDMWQRANGAGEGR